MNEYVDMPQELGNVEGSIWISKNNKHLRYNTDNKDDSVPSWVNPISVYDVGSKDIVKRGAPVSVGLINQLAVEASGPGDSAVVVTDPGVNGWCIGIALEPASITSGNKKIHIQSHGQIEYDLSKKDDERYYLPPHTDKAFTWTYEDIGRPVYVSNKNKGELTLELTDASYDGGTIICVGRVADAPLGTEKDISYQKILLEIQLSGDVRGVVDTAQISVSMTSQVPATGTTITSANDKIFFVKVVNGKGSFILNNDDLKTPSTNVPIGAVVVSPNSEGKIQLSPYYGKDLLVTRLGIISGNFGFTTADTGKTAYLNDGLINFSKGADSVEFKVGTCISETKFLVDCRYTKENAASEMVGTIKPVFGDNLLDAGFALVDQEVHSVLGDEIDWTPLMTNCYSKDIFVFSKSKSGPFTRVAEGGWQLLDETGNTGILSTAKPTYFKFRNLFYTIVGNDGNEKRCACQIKYSAEGTPDAQSYIWPEQAFELSLDEKSGGKAGSSNVLINISNLVQLGAYMDNNGQNIEAYDIVMLNKKNDSMMSPGYSMVNNKVCGYEWQISKIGAATYLELVTVPEGYGASDTLGVTYPYGKALKNPIDVIVTVRRRPTQYNSIYLNQFPKANPWLPHTDANGNLLSGGERIYFGAAVVPGEEDGINDDAVSGVYKTAYKSFMEANFANGIASSKLVIAEGTDKLETIKQIIQYGEGANAKAIEWTYTFSASGDAMAELNASFAPELMTKDLGKISNVEEVDDLKALEINRQLGVKKFTFEKSTSPNVFQTADDRANLKSKTVFTIPIGHGVYDDKTLFIIEQKGFGDGSLSRTILDKYNIINEDNRASYLSNIGLLRKAALELEDRLLMVERVLYGNSPDSTLWNGYKFLEDDNYKISPEEMLILDKGTLGYNHLLRNRLLYDESEFIREEKLLLGTVKKSSSILDSFIIACYFDYSSKYDFEQATEKYFEGMEAGNRRLHDLIRENNEILDATEEGRLVKDVAGVKSVNHIQELWITYKQQEYSHYQMTLQNNGNYKDYQSVDMPSMKKIGSISADKVVPFIVKKGYNWTERMEPRKDEWGDSIPTDGIPYTKYDTSGDDMDLYENHGLPMPWPVTLDAGIKRHISLEKNFFCNTIFGVSDGFEYHNDASKDNVHDAENGEFIPSFYPQSLEGYLFDFEIKLSYLKTLFTASENLKPEITWLRPYLSIEKYKGIEGFEPFGFKNSASLLKYEEGKMYSAFMLKENKISEIFSQYLGKTDIEIHSMVSNAQDLKQVESRYIDTSGQVLDLGTFETVKVSSLTQAFYLFALTLLADSEAALVSSVIRWLIGDYDNSSKSETEYGEDVDPDEIAADVEGSIGDGDAALDINYIKDLYNKYVAAFTNFEKYIYATSKTSDLIPTIGALLKNYKMTITDANGKELTFFSGTETNIIINSKLSYVISDFKKDYKSHYYDKATSLLATKGELEQVLDKVTGVKRINNESWFNLLKEGFEWGAGIPSVDTAGVLQNFSTSEKEIYNQLGRTVTQLKPQSVKEQIVKDVELLLNQGTSDIRKMFPKYNARPGGLILHDLYYKATTEDAGSINYISEGLWSYIFAEYNAVESFVAENTDLFIDDKNSFISLFVRNPPTPELAKPFTYLPLNDNDDNNLDEKIDKKFGVIDVEYVPPEVDDDGNIEQEQDFSEIDALFTDTVHTESRDDELEIKSIKAPITKSYKKDDDAKAIVYSHIKIVEPPEMVPAEYDEDGNLVTPEHLPEPPDPSELEFIKEEHTMLPVGEWVDAEDDEVVFKDDVAYINPDEVVWKADSDRNKDNIVKVDVHAETTVESEAETTVTVSAETDVQADAYTDVDVTAETTVENEASTTVTVTADKLNETLKSLKDILKEVVEKLSEKKNDKEEENADDSVGDETESEADENDDGAEGVNEDVEGDEVADETTDFTELIEKIEALTESITFEATAETTVESTATTTVDATAETTVEVSAVTDVEATAETSITNTATTTASGTFNMKNEFLSKVSWWPYVLRTPLVRKKVPVIVENTDHYHEKTYFLNNLFASKDAYDYEYFVGTDEKDKVVTSPIEEDKKSLKGAKSLRWKLKDKTYIYGTQLPIPDVILNLTAADILDLIRINYSRTGLAGYEYSLDAPKIQTTYPKIEGKRYSRFIIDASDSKNKVVRFSYNGTYYIATDFSVTYIDSTPKGTSATAYKVCSGVFSGGTEGTNETYSFVVTRAQQQFYFSVGSFYVIPKTVKTSTILTNAPFEDRAFILKRVFSTNPVATDNTLRKDEIIATDGGYAVNKDGKKLDEPEVATQALSKVFTEDFVKLMIMNSNVMVTTTRYMQLQTPKSEDIAKLGIMEVHEGDSTELSGIGERGFREFQSVTAEPDMSMIQDVEIFDTLGAACNGI